MSSKQRRWKRKLVLCHKAYMHCVRINKWGRTCTVWIDHMHRADIIIRTAQKQDRVDVVMGRWVAFRARVFA
jgi:hypothetical protein